MTTPSPNPDDVTTRLRIIIAKCASALGNGACISSERSSIEFMEELPGEIEAYTNRLRRQLAERDAVLRTLTASLGSVLAELKPGQSIYPAGASKTNILVSDYHAAIRARSALGEPQ